MSATPGIAKPSAQRMFGETAKLGAPCSRMAPATPSPGGNHLRSYNGTCNAWGYRGWVQVGIDPGQGINRWDYNSSTGPITPIYGRLGSWGRMGSMHGGGANCVFADGSVRFISESADVTLLNNLAAMADGNPIGEIP